MLLMDSLLDQTIPGLDTRLREMFALEDGS